MKLSNEEMDISSVPKDSIIYLSGGITGIDDAEERFENAAKQLKLLGFDKVINPYKMGEGFLYRARHSTYMSVCLKALEAADVILMLKGYECSIGALMERDKAVRKGLEVVYE